MLEIADDIKKHGIYNSNLRIPCINYNMTNDTEITTQYFISDHFPVYPLNKINLINKQQNFKNIIDINSIYDLKLSKILDNNQFNPVEDRIMAFLYSLQLLLPETYHVYIFKLDK